MRNGFYGAPPHAPTMEKGIYARLRLAIRPCGDCIWGFAPCPNRGGINPTSRSYFGKKNPKDPKKPNWIGFRLSSIDSEQGCRRQPCFYVWHSNSNHIVSLPNISEKDVKGLLFRKQQRTGGGFRLSEIGKAIQTLLSAYRTQVKRT